MRRQSRAPLILRLREIEPDLKPGEIAKRVGVSRTYVDYVLNRAARAKARADKPHPVAFLGALTDRPVPTSGRATPGRSRRVGRRPF